MSKLHFTALDEVENWENADDEQEVVVTLGMLREAWPMVQAQREADAIAAKRDKLAAIVAIWFPTNYANNRRTQTEGEKPLIHPAKDWWWNGAYIDDSYEIEWRDDGSVNVHVQSYVGSGEQDGLEVTVPAAWMQADDPKPLIEQWVKDARVKKKEQAKAEAVARAQAEIAAASRRLAELGGAS